MDLKLPQQMDLHDLLALIADPKGMAEYVAKLEALSDEIAMQLEIKGTIEEIKGLRDRAEQDRRLAARDMAEAHEEAARLRAAAEQMAHDANERISAADRRVAAECTEFEAHCKLEVDKLATHAATLRAQEQELAAAQTRVAGQTEWVEKTASDYREKVARLKDFLARV